VLERAGYVVIEARDGREALQIVESDSRNIDILVSDVLMPEISGGELVARAKRIRPTLKVLFVSGHNEDVLAREGIAHGTALLPKPYGPAELLRRVRELLQA
jgi:CheY-like chemotaxis protein